MKIYRIYHEGELIFEGYEDQLFESFGLYPGDSLTAGCEDNDWTFEEEEDEWNG